MSVYRFSLSYNGFQCSTDTGLSLAECGGFMESFLGVVRDGLCHSVEGDRGRLLIEGACSGLACGAIRRIDNVCHCGGVASDGRLGVGSLGIDEPVSVGSRDGGDAVVGVVDGGLCFDGASAPGNGSVEDDRGAVLKEPLLLGDKGPNWARNNEWRMKKKRAKALRRGRVDDSTAGGAAGDPVDSTVPLWRRKDCSLGPEVERKSYFSGLPEKVLSDLKASRARALILRNEREAIEEQRRIDFAASPMFLAQEVVRAVEMSERASKLVDGSAVDPDVGRVSGWAKTVASSYATSVAKSAPSSVLSLSSVTSTGSAGSVAFRKGGRPGKGKFVFDPAGIDRSSVEKLAVKMYFVSEADLVSARKRLGRMLIIEDFIGAKSPFRLSKDQMYDLISSEIEGEEVCGRSYGM